MLNPFFHPYNGGTEKVILEVYSRLAKRHNITVITSAPIERNKRSTEEIEGIKVVRLRTFQERIPIFPLPFLFFDGLTKALAAEKSDIYHINNRYQFFEDTVNVVNRMDRKLALTIHNALPKNIGPVTDDLGRFYDWLWGRKLMHASDLITGVSTYTIRTTVPRSDLKKTHLVFNGVDYNKYKKISKDSESVARLSKRLGLRGKTILTNGRLVPQKGQIYLMRAVADLVHKEHMDLNLLVIGKGPLKQKLLSSARKMGIEKRFRIVSGIDDAHLPYYYNACDVFSLPSLYEPAGLALLEAMSCELPSVISKTGGMPEIADGCGFYSRSKDYYSIKERLRFVLENEKTTARIAKKGRERILKYNDWNKISKQYESLFLDTIRY